MGGGGSKKFLHLLRGVQKVLAACEGGSKKFDDKNFQLPSPPPTKVFMNTPLDDHCGGILWFLQATIVTEHP